MDPPSARMQHPGILQDKNKQMCETVIVFTYILSGEVQIVAIAVHWGNILNILERLFSER